MIKWFDWVKPQTNPKCLTNFPNKLFPAQPSLVLTSCKASHLLSRVQLCHLTIFFDRAYLAWFSWWGKWKGSQLKLENKNSPSSSIHVLPSWESEQEAEVVMQLYLTRNQNTDEGEITLGRRGSRVNFETTNEQNQPQSPYGKSLVLPGVEVKIPTSAVWCAPLQELAVKTAAK